MKGKENGLSFLRIGAFARMANMSASTLSEAVNGQEEKGMDEFVEVLNHGHSGKHEYVARQFSNARKGKLRKQNGQS